MWEKDCLKKIGKGLLGLFGAFVAVAGVVVGLLNDAQKAEVISKTTDFILSVPVWAWSIPAILFFLGLTVLFCWSKKQPASPGAPPLNSFNAKPAEPTRPQITVDNARTNKLNNSNLSGLTTFGDNSPIFQTILHSDENKGADVPPKMTIRALNISQKNQAGFVIAGVKWKENFSDLRVYIHNNDEKPYTDFDAIIETDQAIADAGVISQLNTGTCVAVHHMPSPMVTGKNSHTGDEQVILPMGVMCKQMEIDSHYRVHCDKIAAHSGIEIVLAIVTRPTADTWPILSNERVIPNWVSVRTKFSYCNKQHDSTEQIDLQKTDEP